ncbi:hypothetical protein [Oryzisolibacter sp. LB2S]|uniref:hypothetical protein n=1 Tax=Alicycliphilus soli TaxID=3228789 RepID=UPI0034573B80
MPVLSRAIVFSIPMCGTCSVSRNEKGAARWQHLSELHRPMHNAHFNANENEFYLRS